MSFQKCPICNGTGIEPLSGTSANTQTRCLVCDGRRIINKKTGIPPNRITIEKVVREMPKIVKDAQINYAAQEHVKNVIDELDKTGELPYHTRPTNALKRTEEERDKIRKERALDPSLTVIDKERGRDIFDNLKYKPTETPSEHVSHIQSGESQV
jgi:predicted patatin/cPLA2 family phospholipase